MFDIVELELKNLTPEQKKDMYELLKLDKEFKNFNDGVLDKMWIDYFKAFPDHFVNFQKNNENSLYNQTIKKHGFKDLNYEDIVKDLTKKQKGEIINDIILLMENLKDEEGNSYENKTVIKKMTNRVWEYLKTQVLNEEGKEFFDRNKNSKYIIFFPNNKKKGNVGFFPSDDDLIFFTLNNKELLPKIIYLHEEYLNPHYKVNKWIEKNHELE